MKPIPVLTLAGALLLGALHLPAAESPAASPRSPAELKELATVEQFLGLSDAELEQIQQVIARIRAMKPAERTALRAEIEKYRQLPDAQRQHLRQGWGWMPPEVQDAWREMMQAATPEQRVEMQQKLQAMDPDARLAYRRQLVDEYLKKKAAKK
jgi:Spy/CpxP family protein refolding chaperone